jgi:hypothetical protein
LKEIVPMKRSALRGLGHHLAQLHLQFLTIVPRIEAHGRVYFRHLRCPHRREEAVAEMAAICWRWFVRLVKQGKDPTQFPSALATFAARAVRAGRRLTRMERTKDVLSPRAQRLHGFKVESLPLSTRSSHEHLYSTPYGQRRQDAFEDRLRDNTITPVPEQVQFRIDFPAWLATLTGRERRLIRAMSRNERTLDLSKQFDVSPGRISQMRKEFREGWMRFCGDEEEGKAGPEE